MDIGCCTGTSLKINKGRLSHWCWQISISSKVFYREFNKKKIDAKLHNVSSVTQCVAALVHMAIICQIKHHRLDYLSKYIQFRNRNHCATGSLYIYIYIYISREIFSAKLKDNVKFFALLLILCALVG